MDELSSSEVRHQLLCSLDVGEVRQEATSDTVQIPVSLVSVQVAVPWCVVLEHLVPQRATLWITGIKTNDPQIM